MDMSFFFKNHESPLISRQTIQEKSDNTLTVRRMANLDSSGKGPASRIRIGRKIVYRTSVFREWLESRSQEIEGGNSGE